MKKDSGHQRLNEISELFHDVNQRSVYRHLGDKERKIKIFSDNIIIAQEYVSDRPAAMIESFLDFVQFTQWAFLGRRYLLRGAITLGQVFIDDIFVWGPALVSAYEIESSLSIYPRVVVDASLLKRLPSECFSRLHCGADQMLFVDYFRFRGDDGGRFPYCLRQCRDTLLALWQGADDEKKRQKILWLIAYYNQKCIEDSRGDFLIPVHPQQPESILQVSEEIGKPDLLQLGYPSEDEINHLWYGKNVPH